MTRSIRVLIADDDQAVRDALSALIATDRSLELVGAAEDATGAAELARRHQPDIAILDVKMPGGGGPQAARDIRLITPKTKVLALSAYGDRASVMEMLRAGAVGYLVKGSPSEEILSAIRRAAQGLGSLSAEITGDVIDELAEQLEREDQVSEMRRRITERVRAVLLDGGPRIVFQPIFDLETRQVVGYEGLSRFPGDPSHTPDLWFVDAAEVGLRADLEVSALRAAVAEAAGITDAFLSLNLSPDVLASPRFAALLDHLPTRRLVVEVTEHAPVEDYEVLNGRIERLRAAGIRLAIDDAGAGFASLRHILRLNPDFIKLDVSLTQGIDGDRVRRALASALISFAQEIGAVIVAEGIESAAEVGALQALGVGYGQGYHLAPPAPLSELRDGPPGKARAQAADEPQLAEGG